jgi:hypothetical protein
MKAIPTKYRGYEFRSRLEARWAYLFDVAGVEWRYEPEAYDLGDGDHYLPDFFLPLKPDHWRRKEFEDPGYWIEIKGRRPNDREIRMMHKLCVGSKHHGYIFWGDPGENDPVSCSLEGRVGLPWNNDFTIGLGASVIFCDCREGFASYENVVGFIAKSRQAKFDHGLTPGPRV